MRWLSPQGCFRCVMWCVVHVDSFHVVLTSFSVHDNHVTKRLSHDVALCDSRWKELVMEYMCWLWTYGSCLIWLIRVWISIFRQMNGLYGLMCIVKQDLSKLANSTH